MNFKLLKISHAVMQNWKKNSLTDLTMREGDRKKNALLMYINPCLIDSHVHFLKLRVFLTALTSFTKRIMSINFRFLDLGLTSLGYQWYHSYKAGVFSFSILVLERIRRETWRTLVNTIIDNNFTTSIESQCHWIKEEDEMLVEYIIHIKYTVSKVTGKIMVIFHKIRLKFQIVSDREREIQNFGSNFKFYAHKDIRFSRDVDLLTLYLPGIISCLNEWISST